VCLNVYIDVSNVDNIYAQFHTSHFAFRKQIDGYAVCCSVLQCVMQCVALCYSVLQCFWYLVTPSLAAPAVALPVYVGLFVATIRAQESKYTMCERERAAEREGARGRETGSVCERMFAGRNSECLYACVCEREGERERESKRKRKGVCEWVVTGMQTSTCMCVCVCVCVCVVT